MNLSHFTSKSMLTPYSESQTGRRGDKPDGLWVSVDGPDDWESWCRSEEYVDIDAMNRFGIILSPKASVLVLESVASLREFHARWALSDWNVDWRGVSRRWQGIIITPYQWACRLTEPSWYYTWDCASGCIWDSSAIADVIPVRVNVGTAR